MGIPFAGKWPFLFMPGVNFDRARFFEDASHNRGFSVNAFTDYEKAIRWILSVEDLPDINDPGNKADAADK